MRNASGWRRSYFMCISPCSLRPHSCAQAYHYLDVAAARYYGSGLFGGTRGFGRPAAVYVEHHRRCPSTRPSTCERKRLYQRRTAPIGHVLLHCRGYRRLRANRATEHSNGRVCGAAAAGGNLHWDSTLSLCVYRLDDDPVAMPALEHARVLSCLRDFQGRAATIEVCPILS